MRTLPILGLSAGLVVVASVLAHGQSPATGASARQTSPITLTAPGAREEWVLKIEALPAQGGQALPDHAFLFVATLTECRTPDTFAIVFTVNGGPAIRKQGARLSRQRTPDGGCVDALATVFPARSGEAMVTATSLVVELPGQRFTLSPEQLAYVQQALRIEAADPASASRFARAEGRRRALPTDPAARAAANESYDANERAMALVAQGRLKEARSAAQRAVAAAEQAWGASHPEVGTALVLLAVLERRLGDNKASAATYARAVSSLEPEGPSLALGVALDNRGLVLEDMDDVDGAIASSTRAVEVLMQVDGNSRHTGYALNNLALFWSRKGDHARAVEISDQAIAILRMALADDARALQPFLDDQQEIRRRAAKGDRASRGRR